MPYSRIAPRSHSCAWARSKSSCASSPSPARASRAAEGLVSRTVCRATRGCGRGGTIFVGTRRELSLTYPGSSPSSAQAGAAIESRSITPNPVAQRARIADTVALLWQATFEPTSWYLPEPISATVTQRFLKMPFVLTILGGNENRDVHEPRASLAGPRHNRRFGLRSPAAQAAAEELPGPGAVRGRDGEPAHTTRPVRISPPSGVQVRDSRAIHDPLHATGAPRPGTAQVAARARAGPVLVPSLAAQCSHEMARPRHQVWR